MDKKVGKVDNARWTANIRRHASQTLPKPVEGVLVGFAKEQQGIRIKKDKKAFGLADSLRVVLHAPNGTPAARLHLKIFTEVAHLSDTAMQELSRRVSCRKWKK